MPVARAADHPSLIFRTKSGLEPTLSGNIRHLSVPMEAVRRANSALAVATARCAIRLPDLTFNTPWPAEYLDNECTLIRACRPTKPQVTKSHRRRTGTTSVCVRTKSSGRAKRPKARRRRGAVDVGPDCRDDRAVDCRRDAVPIVAAADGRPPDHRGHRLGLAVKLANLEFLAERGPGVSDHRDGQRGRQRTDDRCQRHGGFESASRGPSGRSTWRIREHAGPGRPRHRRSARRGVLRRVVRRVACDDAEMYPAGPGWLYAERLAMALDEDGPDENQPLVGAGVSRRRANSRCSGASHLARLEVHVLTSTAAVASAPRRSRRPSASPWR